MARAKVNWSEVFPHTCKIYRVVVDEFSTDPEKTEVIYEGCCRDEGNSAMRTYQTNGVLKSDHALQIPEYIQGVTNECILDMTNDCVSLKKIQITSAQPVRYGKRVGTTVFYNEAKN